MIIELNHGHNAPEFNRGCPGSLYSNEAKKAYMHMPMRMHKPINSPLVKATDSSVEPIAILPLRTRGKIKRIKAKIKKPKLIGLVTKGKKSFAVLIMVLRNCSSSMWPRITARIKGARG